MKISIGNDHAGVELKEAIISHLEKDNHTLTNHGTNSSNSVDYADFIHPVAMDVLSEKVSIGIIICGSGNGAAMTANKHQKIRAALCWTPEIAELSRLHNDANIISIPARFVSKLEAKEMLNVFLSTPFEGGRHQKRIEKIDCS
ncbi:MAG: ribose 5-phosphate isomerase B [Flavobacteriaceae bacterium]|nr:ribose 5-phosphate isomerase B [Flavobacteriaceae bacterium]